MVRCLKYNDTYIKQNIQRACSNQYKRILSLGNIHSYCRTHNTINLGYSVWNGVNLIKVSLSITHQQMH
jgi:hypothetical protein